MNEYVLLGLFFLIALFYSSIGFGGGSSYLAILSLMLTDFYEIRTLALVLNVLVVTIGTIVFLRKRVFNWSLFWPFLLLSIPMAFFGAQLRLTEQVFFIILGIALILAAMAILAQSIIKKGMSTNLHASKRMVLGGAIGMLSGLVGIGGGIFLSPTLNLMKWQNAVTVASLASFFILVNSLAGIMGLVVNDTFQLNASFAGGIIIAVMLGGLVGSQLSIKMNLNIIRRLTAILVLYVGVRIVLLHGFDIVI
ncbi:MAG: sulfite exporter TauE/SafE family protein [Pseudomonadales bacterium]|uniref:sulfite exporter TauE/SafE family protein n=1 Tax=Ekhidna sp. TaxID=2608089 RepID=UPI0032EC41D3